MILPKAFLFGNEVHVIWFRYGPLPILDQVGHINGRSARFGLGSWKNMTISAEVSELLHL